MWQFPENPLEHAEALYQKRRVNPDHAIDFLGTPWPPSSWAEALAAECLAIADDTAGDVMDTDNGPRVDSGVIHRAKLRIETRLKLISKWYPQKYGDKIEVEQNGPPHTYTVVIGPGH